MNQGWTYREQVDRQGAGQTLLQFYSQRYQHSTPQEWQERIDSGQILLDGKPASADTVLKVGQQLTYDRPPWQEPDVPLSFQILYEDADLLVVEKPSGLPVLPGGGFLQNTLLYQLQQQYPQATPVPIHRLGRGTSGLMLLARSPLAKAKLSQQMRQNTLGGAIPAKGTDLEKGNDRQIRKTYRTLIGKSELPDRFTLDYAIGKIPHPVLGYVYGAVKGDAVKGDTVKEGLFAYSEAQVLRRTDTTTLLEVTILTGRPHQIRIHLAAAGYPLLGDPLYEAGGLPRLQAVAPGEKLPVPGDCGYLLHAYRLRFPHPRSHQLMDFRCPPPAELT
ncbi:pseudouridine synthase [Leptolyngbya ohadii]|uniref:pseudouridine synthase n=1 Tax=Leptolyngbya ohadii TaxID=1962290 RepID=UPI000B59E214|nr:pseudouridine synthase [Leptolyngbya ohadii]